MPLINRMARVALLFFARSGPGLRPSLPEGRVERRKTGLQTDPIIAGCDVVTVRDSSPGRHQDHRYTLAQALRPQIHDPLYSEAARPRGRGSLMTPSTAGW